MVDQTRVAYGPGRGRRAIGPVGRNRWYAIAFLGLSLFSVERETVATTPWRS